MTVDVRQTYVAFTEPIGATNGVNAHQMQHRSAQVVNLQSVLDGYITPLVGRSVDGLAFYLTPPPAIQIEYPY